MISELDDSRHGRRMHKAVEVLEGVSKTLRKTGRITKVESDRLGMYAALLSFGLWTREEAMKEAVRRFPIEPK